MAFLVISLGLIGSAFALPEKVDLGLITVKDEELAQKLQDQLSAGENFEPLAKKYSVGPAAGRGGRLGKVPVKRLRSEYKNALKGLAAGNPSKVIPTEEGYTILMLFDSRPKPVAKPRPEPSPKPAVKPASPKTPEKPLPPLPKTPQLTARNMTMAGLESLQVGQAKEAEEQFSAALGENPKDDSAAFFLHIAQQVVKKEVKVSAAQEFAKGFIAMLEGRVEKARELFRKAARQDTDFWQAYLFEANMAAALGDSENALKLLKTVVELNPNSTKALISLGTVTRDTGDLENSIVYFERALEKNPESAEALYQTGSSYLLLGKNQEAEKYLRRAIALDPYKDEAYNDLGLALARTNRPKEAEISYRKALELNSNYAPAHLNLGNLYAKHNLLDRAIDEFNKALVVDSTLAIAHSNLAAAYALKQEWDTANDHAQKALKMGFQVPKNLLKELAIHSR
jgi:tetratricopeptide (TPR) repeat protein